MIVGMGRVRYALAWLLVHCRGLAHWVAGRSDRTGLTVPCRGGCESAEPHDAHLARGAIEYLEGRR